MHATVGRRTLGLGILLAFLVTACGSSATPSASAPSAAPSASAPSAAPTQGSKTYTIYLSNAYLGNDWRVQMVKTAQAAVQHDPLKGRVNLKIENSENSVSAQIASLNNIIALKPDAIVVNAASPTGLNPTLEAACAQGILVISFDTLTTAPCSYQVANDFEAGARLGASWLAKTLNGQGKLLEDTGLAGYATSQSIVAGWTSVLKSYPDLGIVGTYEGNYAQGPEQQGVASLLAAHPIVAGILSQGYCTGAMQALESAGHVPVALVCQAYNGTLLACAQKNYPCISTATPPYISAEAIRYAVEILDGNKPASLNVVVPAPCFVSNDVQPDGATCEKMSVGANTFPDVAPGLTLPVSPAWTDITVDEVK